MVNPLVTFREDKNLSRAECGRLLGYEKANPSRFYERIETGEIAADADMVARIVVFTDGVVTAANMHEIRLEWLKTNKPERFNDAGQVEAAE
jgi:hypothetical protein